VVDEVDCLRDAVFLHYEVGGRQSADEMAGLVVDPGFEQHTGHLGNLGDLERLENDFVATLAAFTIFDFDAELPPLERVFIRPLDRVGRPVIVGLVQRAIDIETNWSERDAGRLVYLRHNADRADAACPTEGRCDADGEVWITRARSAKRSRAEQDGGREDHGAGDGRMCRWRCGQHDIS
jgi:hypothetical protein